MVQKYHFHHEFHRNIGEIVLAEITAASVPTLLRRFCDTSHLNTPTRTELLNHNLPLIRKPVTIIINMWSVTKGMQTCNRWQEVPSLNAILNITQIPLLQITKRMSNII